MLLLLLSVAGRTCLFCANFQGARGDAYINASIFLFLEIKAYRERLKPTLRAAQLERGLG